MKEEQIATRAKSEKNAPTTIEISVQPEEREPIIPDATNATSSDQTHEETVNQNVAEVPSNLHLPMFA